MIESSLPCRTRKHLLAALSFFYALLRTSTTHVVSLGRVTTASTWLNYDVKFDLVYSYICMTASFEGKLLTSTKRENYS